MEGPSQDKSRPMLVARKDYAGDLRDPAHMAWEIVRRLRDYRGEKASRTALSARSPCILVEAPPATADWGLCFRRGPGAARSRRAAVLGCGARQERDPRICACGGGQCRPCDQIARASLAHGHPQTGWSRRAGDPGAARRGQTEHIGRHHARWTRHTGISSRRGGPGRQASGAHAIGLPAANRRLAANARSPGVARRSVAPHSHCDGCTREDAFASGNGNRPVRT